MMTLEPPRNKAAHSDGWGAWGLSRAGLSRFANRAQAAVGLDGEVDILLAGDATLRRLNREFRGKDKTTDVLSFPAPEGFCDEHAGDLAISLQTAKRQAKEHGHSLRDEVRVLLLHGMLHLAGFDHETDCGEMAELESILRGELRLPVGLIGRAAMSESDPEVVPGMTKATTYAEFTEGLRKDRKGTSSAPARRRQVAA